MRALLALVMLVMVYVSLLASSGRSQRLSHYSSAAAESSTLAKTGLAAVALAERIVGGAATGAGSHRADEISAAKSEGIRSWRRNRIADQIGLARHRWAVKVDSSSTMRAEGQEEEVHSAAHAAELQARAGLRTSRSRVAWPRELEDGRGPGKLKARDDGGGTGGVGVRNSNRSPAPGMAAAAEVLVEEVARGLGLRNEGRVGDLVDVFELTTGPDPETDHKVTASWVAKLELRVMEREVPGVLWMERQKPLVRETRIIFEEEEEEEGAVLLLPQADDSETISFPDPEFHKQWHLHNSVESKHDINVTGVWQANITGRGVLIAILDDGVESTNQDFAENYNRAGSYDFRQEDKDPSHDAIGKHGTSCAGLIAAATNNVCGVGVAYGAQVSGIRLLGGLVVDATEAKAFLYKAHLNDIYSCSWGPTDNGMSIEGPGAVTKEAIQLAVTKGRCGYGNIIVFASGNGGALDNCNFDGYANSIYTVTIGSLNEENTSPVYMERCPSMLAVTYSSGTYKRKIVTTEVGGCTEHFSGTSASAPIAAGMIALMLEARPCLTWRDVQHLLVYTSRHVESSVVPERQTNGAGFQHSDHMGFGVLDAYWMTMSARVWPLVPDLLEWSSKVQKVHKRISWGGRNMVSLPMTVPETEIVTLEQVAVTINIRYTYRGALAISLVSPAGTTTNLTTVRSKDKSDAGLMDWTLTSAKFWGEEPIGEWRLVVLANETIGGGMKHSGTVLNWRLGLYGSKMAADEIKWRKRLVEEAVSNGTAVPPMECPPKPDNCSYSDLKVHGSWSQSHAYSHLLVVFLVFIIIDLCFLCHLYDNGDASTTSSNAKQHFSHTCIFEFEHEAPGEHKYRTASLRPELDLV